MEEVIVKLPYNQFITLVNFFQLLVVAGLEVNGTGNAIPTKEELKEIWKTLLLTKFK